MLKDELFNEKNLRFKETEILTNMIEKLRKKKDINNKLLEIWIINKFLKNKKKLLKYQNSREKFFLESKSKIAKLYYKLRP